MQEVLNLFMPLLIVLILMVVMDALFGGLVWLVQTIVDAVREY